MGAHINDKIFDSLIEEDEEAIFAQAVCNRDGSNVGTSVTVITDTEFPAAAALNGTWAKTTSTTIVGAAVMANDGTNEILISSGAGTAATALRATLASDDPAVVALQIMDDWDESDRAKVNPIVGQAGVAAGAGTVSATVQRVVLATDGTCPNVTGNVASGAADSGNPVKVGGKYNSTPPTLADGQRGDLQLDSSGNLKVHLATKLDAVNDSIASIPTASATATGADTYFNSALSNTAVAVKASPGTVYGFEFSNTGGANVFVQVFDLATGSVTLGTTVPKLSFFIPVGGANDKVLTVPISFGTAITIAATTTATGNGAPGTALAANVLYK